MERNFPQLGQYQQFYYRPDSPRLVEKRSIMRTVSAVGITMLVYILLKRLMPRVVLVTMMSIGFPTKVQGNVLVGTELTQQLAGVISTTITLVFPALMLYFLLGTHSQLHKLFKKPAPRYAIASLPITAAVAIISAFGMEVLRSTLDRLGIQVFQVEEPYLATTAGKFIYLLSLTLIPAVFEELFFRGVLMHSLRRHGDGFALILSSALFALMHYNIYMVLNAFLMGLLIGYFVIRTGSIITGILMHLANNLLTVGLSELQASLDPSIGAIAVNLIYIILLLFGLLSVVYLVGQDASLFSLHERKSCFTTATKVRYAAGNVFLLVVIIISVFDLLASFGT
jgi:uncharacterized protein